MSMKRTNLVLDEAVLEEASRLSGERTYSATVMRALEDFVRSANSRQILDLRGSGLWEGDLAGMRRDRGGRRPESSAAPSSAPAADAQGPRGGSASPAKGSTRR